MNTFALMARLNAWANERLYGVVAGLSDADYREDRKAFFGSIPHTLNHLLVGHRPCVARPPGTEHDIRSLDPHAASKHTTAVPLHIRPLP